MFRQIEGLSTSATAEIVGASFNTVKQRLHRARALIRKRLAVLVEGKLALAVAFDGRGVTVRATPPALSPAHGP
jgi:hypothetical protein